MTSEIDTSAERVEWLAGMLEALDADPGARMLRALVAERDAMRQRAEKAEAERDEARRWRAKAWLKAEERATALVDKGARDLNAAIRNAAECGLSVAVDVAEYHYDMRILPLPFVVPYVYRHQTAAENGEMGET